MQKHAIIFALSVLLLVPIAVLNVYGDDFETRRDTYFLSRGDVFLITSPISPNPILIPLTGDSLPGFPDTIVQRLTDVPIPPQGSSTGPIQTEMVQLELKSIAPITVPLTGESWIVKVELDLPPFPIGTMTINKDNPSGGTFSSSLPIEPKFIFTRVAGGPATTVEQLYDLQLDLSGQNWTHFPCSNSFFPTGLTNWIVTGTGTSAGTTGTLFLSPIPDESQCLVGGEIIPIEQTSLILAGAQSFSFMIPVLVSAIGIGLFVVSRKSELNS